MMSSLQNLFIKQGPLPSAIVQLLLQMRAYEKMPVTSSMNDSYHGICAFTTIFELSLRCLQ